MLLQQIMHPRQLKGPGLIYLNACDIPGWSLKAASWKSSHLQLVQHVPQGCRSITRLKTYAVHLALAFVRHKNQQARFWTTLLRLTSLSLLIVTHAFTCTLSFSCFSRALYLWSSRYSTVILSCGGSTN